MALLQTAAALTMTLCWVSAMCSISTSRAEQATWSEHFFEQKHESLDRSFSVELQDLLSWAGNSAKIHCSALAADENLAVRGVVARKYIPAKSVIISIPRKMALSVKAGQSSPMPDLVPEKLWKSLDASIQIALVLIRETKRGSESPWHVWIQSLPRRFTTLMHWNQQQLDQLHMNSTTAEQDFLTRVRKQKETVHASYRKLQRAPVASKWNLTPDELVWAVNVATSRPFSIPSHWTESIAESMTPIIIGSVGLLGIVLFKSQSFSHWQNSKEIVSCCRFVLAMSVLATAVRSLYEQIGVSTAALVPILDIINHSSTSSSQIEQTWFSNRLLAVIGRQVQPGHEWVKQHFHAETGRVQAAEKSKAASKLLKQAQLTREGWSSDSMQALHKLLAADSHSPFDMLGSLESVQYYREPPAKGTADQAITQVYQVLYHVCQQVIASKPTTLVEDIASLQQAQDLEVQDQHFILALQLRIGKKELLQSCLWQYDPEQL
ncbi:TPA: Ribosomal lysine N-methyltransferase 4, variant 3 [Trebouxia sp. C0004]